MAYTNSPNMTLTIPTVGSQPGPDYAYNVNNSLSLIDSHDHSQGRGVQVTPAGLNINDNLNIQSHNLTNVNNVVFSTQPSNSTVQALYVAPGTEFPPINDLFFNDGNGNVIQITSGGNVNATAASIPGESYAAGTFFWKQGTGSTTPANFDIGSITLRPNVALTSFGVRLRPPAAIASQYDISLPLLPTGGTKIMTMDTGGNMYAITDVDNSTLEISANLLRVKDLGMTTSKIANSAVTTIKIADGAVTAAKLDPSINFHLQHVEFTPVVATFAVRLASTANLSLSGLAAIDGVTPIAGDLILAKNQTSAAANGVYVAAAGGWVRDVNYDTAAEINYAAVTVTAGTINAGTSWYQNTIITTIGVDSQSWSLSSTQAWVVPAGVTSINVMIAGAGGGGGGGQSPASGTDALGGGGGAGALPQYTQLVTTPGETLNITIGGGGKGGRSGAGSTGGSSSIKRTNTVVYAAAGGAGGGVGGTSGSGLGLGAPEVVSALVTQVGGGNSTSASVSSSGGNSQFAVGGIGGTEGSSSGGQGGGGGGAGIGDGGIGGNGGAGFTSNHGLTGGTGGTSAGGGGGGSGGNTSLSDPGGDGGPGYVLISYL